MRWFIIEDGIRLGPFTADEIHTKLRSGDLSLDSVVAREGSSVRRRLVDVPELLKTGGTVIRRPEEIDPHEDKTQVAAIAVEDKPNGETKKEQLSFDDVRGATVVSSVPFEVGEIGRTDLPTEQRFSLRADAAPRREFPLEPIKVESAPVRESKKSAPEETQEIVPERKEEKLIGARPQESRSAPKVSGQAKDLSLDLGITPSKQEFQSVSNQLRGGDAKDIRSLALDLESSRTVEKSWNLLEEKVVKKAEYPKGSDQRQGRAPAKEKASAPVPAAKERQRQDDLYIELDSKDSKALQFGEKKSKKESNRRNEIVDEQEHADDKGETVSLASFEINGQEVSGQKAPGKARQLSAKANPSTGEGKNQGDRKPGSAKSANTSDSPRTRSEHRNRQKQMAAASQARKRASLFKDLASVALLSAAVMLVIAVAAYLLLRSPGVQRRLGFTPGGGASVELGSTNGGSQTFDPNEALIVATRKPTLPGPTMTPKPLPGPTLSAKPLPHSGDGGRDEPHSSGKNRSNSKKRHSVPENWPRPIVKTGRELAKQGSQPFSVQNVTVKSVPASCVPCRVKAKLNDGSRVLLISPGVKAWEGAGKAEKDARVNVKGKVLRRTKGETWILVQGIDEY